MHRAEAETVLERYQFNESRLACNDDSLFKLPPGGTQGQFFVILSHAIINVRNEVFHQFLIVRLMPNSSMKKL